MLFTEAPIDVHIFCEEGSDDHSHAIRQPALGAQLPHCGVDERVAGFPGFPELEARGGEGGGAPGDGRVGRFEGFVHADVGPGGEDVAVEVAPGELGDPGCDAGGGAREGVVVGGEDGVEAGAHGEGAGCEVRGEDGCAGGGGGVAVVGVGVDAVADECCEAGVG